MNISKKEAAMVFAAIVELNEPEQIVEILGEENVLKVGKHLRGFGENITIKERKEMAQQLLIDCCDYIISEPIKPIAPTINITVNSPSLVGDVVTERLVEQLKAALKGI